MNTTPMQGADWIKLGLTTAVAATLGLACVIAPPYLIPGGIGHAYEAPLFPVLRTAWENFAFVPSIILLFVLGIGLGAAQPRFWWLVGAAPVALLPLAAILEMFVDPSSHNLFPLEFVAYGFVGIASFLGALLGKGIRCWTRPKTAAF